MTLPDSKVSKAVAFKRIQTLQQKIDDPLNVKTNSDKPSSRFDMHYQTNI